VILAEVCGKAGELDEGFRLLVNSLTEVRDSGEAWWEPELYRVRGELLLHVGTADAESEAEACLQKALSIARQQQAKLMELRTAVCLSRLWQRQGKKINARELLAEIYNWFTEGFDTADLREAKTLLADLG
jgi:predicted ATPase